MKALIREVVTFIGRVEQDKSYRSERFILPPCSGSCLV